MKNSFATLVACVWCGMALLRSTGVKLRPKRGTVVVCVLKCLSRSRLGGSIPPLRTIHSRRLHQAPPSGRKPTRKQLPTVDLQADLCRRGLAVEPSS